MRGGASGAAGALSIQKSLGSGGSLITPVQGFSDGAMQPPKPTMPAKSVLSHATLLGLGLVKSSAPIAGITPMAQRAASWLRGTPSVSLVGEAGEKFFKSQKITPAAGFAAASKRGGIPRAFGRGLRTVWGAVPGKKWLGAGAGLYGAARAAGAATQSVGMHRNTAHAERSQQLLQSRHGVRSVWEHGTGHQHRAPVPNNSHQFRAPPVNQG